MTEPNLFGVRKKGEQGVYFEGRDFLYVTPMMLVKAAAFASEPTSAVNKRLEARQPGGTDKIRDHLDYLLTVLHECRRADLREVFDEGRVNEDVYIAIMEALGCMVLRQFNRVHREFTFTNMTGQRDEPTQYVDNAAALRYYDTLTEGF